ncbi:hypothetical protein BIV23_40740 [Streptomyces monashensis]|uniref:DUF1524 domain-containing protein n=1 Tax=Streptomyces monashensis TaxID=1678012 RepID=A0A1S2PA94_9ACTN|nr:hypothetical protein BIV23_40740 [Streptomyces monashensis]
MYCGVLQQALCGGVHVAVESLEPALLQGALRLERTGNRSKGDQSPDQWAPPNKDYWCTYARAWTDVKYGYGLSITAPEKNKLVEMLNTCD